jgi:flagellar biosynthesis protein FlhA
VAQIPSLLLAIATAIIVTRVSSPQDMAAHIGQEMNLTRAWVPVGVVMTIIGLTPGMPNALFLFFAALAFGAAFFANRNERARATVEEEEGDAEIDGKSEPEAITLADVTDYSPVSLQIGYGLIGLVDADKGGPLVARITAIRREVSRALGFVVPGVRIRDDLGLEANQYRIRIGQTIVGEDRIYPDRKLALPGERTAIQIDGIEAKDPSFGMDAIWIRPQQQAEAEANDYVVIEPESVLATHLSQLLYKHAAELIGQDDVQALVDNLAASSPNLVQSVVPKLVPLHVLTAVLRALLAERIPISDLRRILEGLAAIQNRNAAPADIAELLRPALAPLLIQQVAPLGRPLPVVTLTPDLEQLLLRTLRQGGEGELMLEGELAQQLVRSVNETTERLAAEGRNAVVVVAPQIRRAFAAFLRSHLPEAIVLGFTELPENRRVEVAATIGGAGALPRDNQPSRK